MPPAPGADPVDHGARVQDLPPGLSPRAAPRRTTIACHSAVKLGDRLAREEIESLIKEWLTSRLPATCPHGRSICYRIPIKEMARKLDRH